MAIHERAFVILPADNAGEFYRRVLDSTEIQRLYLAGAITQACLDAGERLQAEWYLSGLAGHGASWKSWTGGIARALVEDMSEQQEASWRACTAAIESINDRWARVVTSAVVIDNIPCKNAVALRVGLAALSKHYGVI